MLLNLQITQTLSIHQLISISNRTKFRTILKSSTINRLRFARSSLWYLYRPCIKAQHAVHSLYLDKSVKSQSKSSSSRRIKRKHWWVQISLNSRHSNRNETVQRWNPLSLRGNQTRCQGKNLALNLRLSRQALVNHVSHCIQRIKYHWSHS